MADFQAGLKVLRKITEEQKNWQSGLLQIETLLTAAEAAERVLRDQTQRVRALGAEIARLAPEAERLRAEVAGFHKQRDAQAQELKAQAAPLRETLADLERQIAAKREELERVKATLRDLGARVAGAA